MDSNPLDTSNELGTLLEAALRYAKAARRKKNLLGTDASAVDFEIATIIVKIAEQAAEDEMASRLSSE